MREPPFGVLDRPRSQVDAMHLGAALGERLVVGSQAHADLERAEALRPGKSREPGDVGLQAVSLRAVGVVSVARLAGEQLLLAAAGAVPKIVNLGLCDVRQGA